MTVTLKGARIMAGYTQSQVADALHMHVQTYRKLEECPDSATVEQAKAISHLLGVSYDEIFFTK